MLTTAPLTRATTSTTGVLRALKGAGAGSAVHADDGATRRTRPNAWAVHKGRCGLMSILDGAGKNRFGVLLEGKFSPRRDSAEGPFPSFAIFPAAGGTIAPAVCILPVRRA